MVTLAPSTRSTTITLASATAGPFFLGYRLFDTDGLEVYVNSIRRTDWTLSATFTGGFTDAARITFTAPLAAADVLIIDGALTPDREADYLNTDPGMARKLNSELPRIWSSLQEVTRKANQSVRGFTAIAPFVPADGATIIFQDGQPTAGPTVDQISAAQANAEAATAGALAVAAALAIITTISAGNILRASYIFSGTGTSAALTLPVTPNNKVQLDIRVNGNTIHGNAYVLAGDQVTPNAGYTWPVGTENIEVVFSGIATLANAVSIVEFNAKEPFTTRALMLAASIPSSVKIIAHYTATGQIVEYSASASNVAATTADGRTWTWAECLTLEHFGAVGDGVTDDTLAIRAAVLAAGVSFAATGVVQQVVCDGRYIWGAGAFYDATADWRHYVYVPNGVFIKGSGVFISSVVFAARAVGFVCRGDNILFEGVTFLDTATAASNFIVPIGAGTAYDSGLTSNRTYKGLTVRNVIGRNNWLTASVQMINSDDGTIAWEQIRFEDSESFARPAAVSCGNFNVRSDPPGKIRDVRMAGCKAYDGKTASSFNFVGIYGFTNIGNTSYRNEFAATEMENGCQDGVWDNIRSVDDIIGVWIDDSRNIVGGTVSMLTERNLITPPLGAVAHRNRPAIMITYEGFASDTGYITTGIITGSVVGNGGRINVGSFGGGGGGGIGTLDIGIGSLVADAVVRDTGNSSVVVNVPSGANITLRNGVITGAATNAILATIAAGAIVRILDVSTRKLAAESSTGIVTSGAGKLIARGFNPHSVSYSHTGGIDLTDYRINNVNQPDRRYFATVNIADDGVAEIALPVGISAGNIFIQRSGSATHWGTARIVWSGAFASAALAGTNGANFDINATSGVLTGTTGTDGKTTMRVNLLDKLFVENRSGSASDYLVSWFA